MSSVQLSCSFSYPQHMTGAIIPTIRRRVLACQRLLVRQQQALVGSEEIRFPKGITGRIHSNRLHETQTLVHLGSKITVPASLFGRLDKVQVPRVESGKISVSSSRESSQNVNRLSTLVISFDHVERIVATSFRCKLLSIDNVPTVRRQRNTISHLIWFRAGFRKLPSHPPNLDDGHGRTKSQDQGHLQNHPKGVAHMIHVELCKGLGTIPTHQQEALSLTGPRQLLVERTNLSGKDQRGTAAQLVDRLLQFCGIVIDRHLLRFSLLPRVWSPLYLFWKGRRR
mmetsp:Transcript_18656/g.43289  ORF Transcript_18656/g.43289 Transcript_18656/m.43289 type:complete len:283 (+) Transcript_18656:640-1488(+)